MPYRFAIPLQIPAQLTTHLKSLRKAKGLTQAALGERIGVKQVRVADIERDPGAVSIAQLMQVLHALDARLLIETIEPPSASGHSVREPEASW